MQCSWWSPEQGRGKGRRETVLGGLSQISSPSPRHRVQWRAICEAALAKESRYVFRLDVTRKPQVFFVILSFCIGLGQTWIQMSALLQTNSKPHFPQQHLFESVVGLP